MGLGLEIILIYLVIINYLAAYTCAHDKQMARTNKRRVSEETLFLISLLGGSITMYIVMLVIRHKTRKKDL